jgi:hypothetical protein
VLKLLRNVQRALKQWRALPATERDQYKDRVDRIRSLVMELGGQRALDYVNGSGGSPEDSTDERDLPPRQRADVIAELQVETSSLLTALVTPAAGLATDSVPRSARIGAKLASKGLRRAIRHYSR